MYWWVNQSPARRHELDGGYLWSAETAIRGAQPNDMVFVHAAGRIGALGLVCGAPFAARGMGAGSKRNARVARAGAEGWRLPVHVEELLQPLRPREHLAEFRPLLPRRHSPLRAAGDANPTVYFTAIDPVLAARICQLLGGQVEELQRAAPALGSSQLADDAAEHALRARTDLDAGTRKRLLSARRGLGVFRDNVERHEQACRLTGLLDRRHLRARHIKPWRESNDREKLDGCNGLLLSPHVDQLFERGLISFGDTGELLIARQLNPAVLHAWRIAPPHNVGAFQAGQCAYLAWHREQVFEQLESGRRAADS